MVEHRLYISMFNLDFLKINLIFWLQYNYL